jgi:dipeptidyl aminopeptidase/acylaminoacyl peptidase
MRWIGILLLAMLGACSTTRSVTVTAVPGDAALKLDGESIGTGTATRDIVFQNAQDVHVIAASRLGYKDQSVTLMRDDGRDLIRLELKPQSKHIHVLVEPVAAIVSVDGKAVSADPVSDRAVDLDFTVDASNKWTTHEISAERVGFATARATVAWADAGSDYTLVMGPMTRDVSITTNPPGAAVALDGKSIGVSPTTMPAVPFMYDILKSQYATHKITVSKPGYDPVDRAISFNDPAAAYAINLEPKSKTVRIVTDPAGAVVTIDGKELARDAAGISSGALQFPPVDEKGTLRTFTAAVSKKTADSEWEPGQLTIAYDDGKADYSIALKEIKTRPLDELTVEFSRNMQGVWEAAPKVVSTLARKDVTEGPDRQQPVQLVRAERGTTINSLAMSPDGTQLMFTEVWGTTKDDLRSRILVIKPDGTGGTEQLTDGKALDLFPSFTPAGDQIVFSSNRAGKKLSVWEKSAVGAPGTAQLTSNDEQELWPAVDADPQPRLFYEALLDDRDEPRLYMTQIGRTIRTELTTVPVTQPRVSPKADNLVFASVNAKTGNRELFIMPDKGGLTHNLTNTPDSDNFDPVWSKDGSRIAFVSDRGLDEDRHHNRDIWYIDMAHPERPVQITTNGSVDDCPTWDPSGDAIYFRSNRGGEWGIWKIAVK